MLFIVVEFCPPLLSNRDWLIFCKFVLFLQDYYGYNPYMNFGGVDGSGYYQSYGSDAMLSSYSWNSSYGGDYRNGGAKSTARNSSVNSNGFNSVKTGDVKISSDVKSRQSFTPLSKPIIQNQPLKPLDKVYYETVLVFDTVHFLVHLIIIVTMCGTDESCLSFTGSAERFFFCWKIPFIVYKP